MNIFSYNENKNDDVGDEPARVVLKKNQEARLLRHSKETKEQLSKIQDRIQFTLNQYEVPDNLVDEPVLPLDQISDTSTNLEFVEDLNQLVTIISDPVTKQKYQHYVSIFIVGYEKQCGNRLLLLSQINDFFCHYENDEIPDISSPDFNIDDIGESVSVTLDKASAIQERLKSLSGNVMSILNEVTPSKSKIAAKKKTDKALLQSKENLVHVTEKLMAAKEEIQHNNEKMAQVYRTLEVKQVEIQRLKTQIDASKRKSAEKQKFVDDISKKDNEITKLKEERSKYKSEVEQLQMSIDAQEQLQKHNSEIQQKKDLEHSYELQVLKEQIIQVRKDAEIQFEQKLEEIKFNNKEAVDSLKKNQANVTSKLHEELAYVKKELERVIQLKDETVNALLTEQAKQEMKDKDSAFNTSVDKMVKFHKEIKELESENRKLKAKLELEKQLKESIMAEQESQENTSAEPVSEKVCRTIETQTNDDLSNEGTKQHEALALLEHTDTEKSSEDLKQELIQIKSKFNDNINLVTRLMKQKEKILKERSSLEKELIKCQKEKELLESKLSTETKHDSSNIPEENNKQVHSKQIKISEISNQSKSTQTLASTAGLQDVSVSPMQHLLSEPVLQNDFKEDKQSDDNESVISFELVEDVKEFYKEVLVLKEELVTVMKNNVLISTNIAPLKEIQLKSTQSDNLLHQLEVIISNAKNVIKLMSDILPKVVDQRSDSVDMNDDDLDSLPSIIPDDEKPMNVRQNVGDDEIVSHQPHPVNSKLMQDNNVNSKLMQDYRALLDEHTTLEQDFKQLKEEFDQSQLSNENVITQNYDVIADLQNTVTKLQDRINISTMKTKSFLKPEEFIFTRNNREYNERVLMQHANRLNMQKIDELQKVMKKYTSVPIKRWQRMMRRYLHHKRMKDIERCIKSREYNVSLLIDQMEKLQSQRALNWMTSSDELSKERLEIANILLDRLKTVEKENGLFLIKPFNTYEDKKLEKDRKAMKSKQCLDDLLRKSDENVITNPFSTKQLSTHLPPPPTLWKPPVSMNKESVSNFHTHIPRILSLDVNRSMFADNLISVSIPTNRVEHDTDKQLNLISYMTVGRSVSAEKSRVNNIQDGTLPSTKRPQSLPALRNRSRISVHRFDMDEFRSKEPLPSI